MWVYSGGESMCRLLTANKVPFDLPTKASKSDTVHVKTGFIWKFSRERFLWTRYASWGSLLKKPQSPDVTLNRIAVQEIFALEALL